MKRSTDAPTLFSPAGVVVGMRPEKVECDGCNNIIITHRYPAIVPHNLDITIPTDEPDTYEDRGYTLCSECRLKVVDWIEDTTTAETRVDLPDLNTAIELYAEQYATNKRMAEALKDLRDGKND